MHYGRMYRWGNPLKSMYCRDNCVFPRSRARAIVEERLERAKRAYQLVTGLQNRLRWKQEIAELEAELTGEKEATQCR